MKLTQTVNLMGLMASAFVVGYIVGLNPAMPADAQGETFLVRVTAYCPCEKCCPGTSDGITANGHRIKSGERFVAADKRFAFGTSMVIPGYNDSQPVKVLDRGGAIKGNKIDVFFDDDPRTGKSGHQIALEWGVKHLVVTVAKGE